jgi:hypothetical protein
MRRLVMKRLALLLLVSAALTAPVAGDVMIRSVYRTDTVVDGAVAASEKTGEDVLWIGKDRISYRTPQIHVVVDRDRGKVLFGDPARKACLEMPLPLDVAKLRATLDALGYRLQPAFGKVRATEETREIQGVSCKQYEVEAWQLEGEAPTNRRRIVVWAAESLPHEIDLSLVREMLECLRAFYNRDEGYRTELRKIRGVQLGLQVDDGSDRRYVEETIEIAEKEPSAGTYDVPEDYRRLAN